MSERFVGDRSTGGDDPVGADPAGDDVGADRLEIIDASSGGRFHHAMSDQRSRAHAFERLLRWQRMRHDLMEPLSLDENLVVGADRAIDLRPVTANAERPAHPRSAAS